MVAFSSDARSVLSPERLNQKLMFLGGKKVGDKDGELYLHPKNSHVCLLYEPWLSTLL